eukprot:956959-Prymnesium_polylepis.1
MVSASGTRPWGSHVRVASSRQDEWCAIVSPVPSWHWRTFRPSHLAGHCQARAVTHSTSLRGPFFASFCAQQVPSRVRPQ